MHHRTDLNQSPIVEGLRALGFSVAVTSDVGNGFGDIVCGVRGRNLILEVKQPGQQKSLTPAEALFHSEWRGQVDVVTTLDEALAVVERETT